MSNSWDEMRKAKEDSYFAAKEKEALERLSTKTKRISPVSGEPMEQITLHGVNIDRCPSSGGVWLDAGELEHLLKIAHDEGVKDAGTQGQIQGFLASFLRTISAPAKKGS